MTGVQTAEITGLLQAWTRGDQEPLNHLAPFVYSELHRMAKGYIRRERAELALQTTTLVHETYLRLVELRFLGGLSAEETAEVLDISAHCVMHDWKPAKAFLTRELSPKGGES